MLTRKYLFLYSICILANAFSAVAMEDQEKSMIEQALALSFESERTKARNRVLEAAEVRQAQALSLTALSKVDTEKEAITKATALSLLTARPIDDEDDQILLAVLQQSIEQIPNKFSDQDEEEIARLLSACGLPIAISELVFAYRDNMIQLKVKSQIDNDGGGGASCGYHALKNGFPIAEALLSREEKMFNAIGKLNDPHHVANLFGLKNKQSDWRTSLIHKRKKKVIADFIYDTLLEHIAATKVETAGENRPDGTMVYRLNLKNKWITLTDPEEADLIKECISAFRDVANNAVEQLELSEHSAVAGKELSNMFIQLGHNSAVLEYCLPDLNTLVFDCGGDWVVEDTTGLGYHFANSPHCLSGEWLTNDEMLYLIKEFRLNSLTLPILCVGDNGLGRTLEEQLDLQDFRIFKNLMKEKSFFLGIVFIYHQNHWFTCVIQKIATQVCYIIADSLNTNLFDYTNRLADDNLRELIECLNKS